MAGAQAATFDSTLPLKVYERGVNGEPDRILGFTPVQANRTISVPAGRIWYVRPIGSLTGPKLRRLAEEIQQNHIPGLDLSDHWELSDESVSHLEKLTSLRFLDISRTRLTDAAMPSVRSLTRLAVLLLPAKVSDRGLTELHGLPLAELSLDRTGVSAGGLQALVAFPALERLDISDTAIDDAGLAPLSRLPRLRRIVLNGRITDGGAARLAQIRSLEEIDLSQTAIGDKGVESLASLPNLKVLYANKKMSDSGLRYLAQSPSLRSLDLSGSAVTDRGIEFLAKRNSLKELALSQTAVGNKCLPFLARLPQLRVLELSDTQVTQAGLAPLARAKSLKVLSLSWQRLTREDLVGMARLAQLKTIVLNGTPLPDDTMAQLRQLNRASPWSPVQSFERANQALAVPVAIQEASVLPERSLPEVPVGRAAPKPLKIWLPAGRPRGTHSDDLAMLPSMPDRLEASRVRTSTAGVLQVKPLSAGQSSKRALEAPSAALSSLPEMGGPEKSELATDIKTHEDDLLKIITLKSRPSRKGLTGLSAMRRISEDKEGVLSDMAFSKEDASIEIRQDQPEDSLGEIQVNVTPTRRR